MELHRFDDEVSIPSTGAAPGHRTGALIADGSRVRIEVLHVPAGGGIARQPAVAPRLIAVVAGAGWVAGGDGQRRPLGAGRAATWDAGEEHELHSDGGLTAICVDGDFEISAVAVTRDIVVADHDPRWWAWFEEVRRHVWPTVADVAVRIDHVGSTSVPGLAAKPIIDLDVVVATEDRIAPAIERLASIGYRWRGDLGVVGREAFAPPAAADLPEHHLYLVVEDNRAHLDHWLLRDVLRADADARDRYAELKRRNAHEANRDIDVYVAAKARFVAELLTRARAERGLEPVTYWDPELPSA